jgi:excisionase family DNA binding protein
LRRTKGAALSFKETNNEEQTVERVRRRPVTTLPSKIYQEPERRRLLHESFINNRLGPEYLSLPELAVYASVGRNTLKKWLKDGMPYYRVGRCIRVRVDEFNQWMSRFRSGTFKDLDTILDQVMMEV